MNRAERIGVYLVILGLISTVVMLSGCASPCSGNERNMSCMSTEQLERELNG